jgi:hypothetical protein
MNSNDFSITSTGLLSLGGNPLSSQRLILALVVAPGFGITIGLEEIPPSIFTRD